MARDRINGTYYGILQYYYPATAKILAAKPLSQWTDNDFTMMRTALDKFENDATNPVNQLTADLQALVTSYDKLQSPAAMITTRREVRRTTRPPSGPPQETRRSSTSST